MTVSFCTGGCFADFVAFFGFAEDVEEGEEGEEGEIPAYAIINRFASLSSPCFAFSLFSSFSPSSSI